MSDNGKWNNIVIGNNHSIIIWRVVVIISNRNYRNSKIYNNKWW